MLAEVKETFEEARFPKTFAGKIRSTASIRNIPRHRCRLEFTKAARQERWLPTWLAIPYSLQPVSALCRIPEQLARAPTKSPGFTVRF
ncbi:hypothetical protein MRX96_037823 [Rhipicephalus microplus]